MGKKLSFKFEEVSVGLSPKDRLFIKVKTLGQEARVMFPKKYALKLSNALKDLSDD